MTCPRKSLTGLLQYLSLKVMQQPLAPYQLANRLQRWNPGEGGQRSTVPAPRAPPALSGAWTTGL